MQAVIFAAYVAFLYFPMKKLRWQILIVVITLIIVGVLLLTQQPSLSPITIEPASGGIYSEALIGSFGRLNPLFDLNNPCDRDIDRLIFSSLIRFDSRGTPMADLAESWAVSSNGTIYNVTIRPNAYWHDGTPVTSDDVLFTLELLRSQFSSYSDDIRAMWDVVTITKINEKNIKFVLPEPFVPFLDYLTFGVLPKHLLGETPADQLVTSDFNLQPIGSGPFEVSSLIVENGQVAGVELQRSDNYYGQASFIEQVIFRFYPDPESALAAYRRGDVLAISQVTPEILQDSLQEPNLSLYSSRLPKLTLVLLNLQNQDKPYFQDKNVRHAMMMSLNRQWMVDQFLMGQGILAGSPILPDTWAYYDGIDPIGFDPMAAEDILKNAGYTLPADSTIREKDGVSLSFTLLYPDTEFHGQIAQTIRDNWNAIGIDAQLIALPYETLLNDHLLTRSYDAALIDLDLSRSYDPDPYPFWHQAEAALGQNYSQWDNRSASEYLEQGRVIANPDTRMRLYRNFQVIFARELPALPLFFPVYTYGVDSRVLGVQSPPLFEPADRFNGISSWFLVTRRALEETQQPTIIP